jgi:L-ascorbate metabolism protein UlaG (beta-lactamase superfamily)
MKIKEGVDIDFLGHAGFLINYRNGEMKKVVIDPYNISERAGNNKADLILISHSHYDHCSIQDIEKLVKPGSVIVATPDCQSKITKINNVDMQIMEVGDKLEFGKVKVEAVAAYNVNKDFHPKKEGWLGFVVKVNDVIIYYSGDSDKIPEMKNLTGYGKHGQEFVVLLPVSGTYVMDSEEAFEVASMLSPDLCIPMHYGGGVAGTVEDADNFVKKCDEFGLKAVVLEKI